MNENLKSELLGIKAFLENAEGLKNTLRSAHTSTGRPESTAEHTWRLCLFASVIGNYYAEIDLLRLVKMVIIHDLGEIINGDIPAIDQDPSVDKNDSERVDFLQVIQPLPDAIKTEFIGLWDEYNAVATLEAKLAKGLDKLETLLQHVQGKNPENFDYEFNLSYGQPYTGFDALITYFRAEIDKDTRSRITPKT